MLEEEDPLHQLVQLITLAASAIKEMAKDNRTNQDAISEAGAIPPLVQLAYSMGSLLGSGAQLQEASQERWELQLQLAAV